MNAIAPIGEWCNVCRCRTLPLDNGCCAFCDHHLVTGEVDRVAAEQTRRARERMRAARNSASYRGRTRPPTHDPTVAE